MTLLDQPLGRLFRLGFITSLTCLLPLFELGAAVRMMGGPGGFVWNSRPVAAPASFLVAALLAVVLSLVGAAVQTVGAAALGLFRRQVEAPDVAEEAS